MLESFAEETSDVLKSSTTVTKVSNAYKRRRTTLPGLIKGGLGGCLPLKQYGSKVYTLMFV